jgi:V/A-type H+-transporting ATPase subunit K
MNEFVVALGWLGVFSPMALGAIGSVIGCAVAGQAAIGAMVDTESGYGRYIGVSVMPS